MRLRLLNFNSMPERRESNSLPAPLDDSWAHELGQFEIRNGPTSQRHDILALFSRAFEIAAAQPEKPVLRYAVARVQELKVHQQAWRTFQNCLLGAAGADPATMAVVLGTLFKVAATSGQNCRNRSLKGDLRGCHCEARAERAGKRSGIGCLWGALAWKVNLS